MAKLAATAEEAAMRALQEVSREGMAAEAADPPGPGRRMRMRLGVFFYAEPVADAPRAGDATPGGGASTSKARSRS